MPTTIPRTHTPTPWHVNTQIRRKLYIEGATSFIADLQYEECTDYTRAQCRADAEYIVRCVNSHDALLEALKLATHELNAIRARDGAPQHIDWDRGRPIQTDSCTHEWWNTLTDQCFAAIAQAEEVPHA